MTFKDTVKKALNNLDDNIGNTGVYKVKVMLSSGFSTTIPIEAASAEIAKARANDLKSHMDTSSSSLKIVKIEDVSSEPTPLKRGPGKHLAKPGAFNALKGIIKNRNTRGGHFA